MTYFDVLHFETLDVEVVQPQQSDGVRNLKTCAPISVLKETGRRLTRGNMASDTQDCSGTEDRVWAVNWRTEEEGMHEIRRLLQVSNVRSVP